MKLAQAFIDAGHELFEVGGCVRDKLLGVEPNDVDFATSASPDQTSEILANAGFKVIPIGIEFGTIQTEVAGEKVEITTFRCKESYTKGSRKPAVVFGKTIQEDLARRDFTFNAIAYRVGPGSIVDPFGGASDLAAGVIRTPGDPTVAFTDDPLRMLRAARFVARGLGDIHETTLKAMIDHRKLVHDLSAERVFEEMTKLLVSANPVKGLEVLEVTGLLGELFPELQTVVDFREDPGRWHRLPVWEHTLEVVAGVSPVSEVRWAALFHDVAKPMCWSVTDTGTHFYEHDHVGAKVWEIVAGRLKTSRKFRETVSQLIWEHQNLRNQMGPKGVRRLIHRLGDNLDLLFDLAQSDIRAHVEHIVEPKLKELAALHARVRKVWAGPAPVTNRLPKGTGNLLQTKLGLKGPDLGVVMKRLQKMMVEGTITAESDLVKVAKGTL